MRCPVSSTDAIVVKGHVPADPQTLFDAFLDAAAHAAMTGSEATNGEDGRFSAWGGYITGRTVETHPPHRIVQRWRTSQFPEHAPDSSLEIRFTAVDGGTELAFVHSNIPAGQGASYEQGWVDHYLEPMRAWLG